MRGGKGHFSKRPFLYFMNKMYLFIGNCYAKFTCVNGYFPVLLAGKAAKKAAKKAKKTPAPGSGIKANPFSYVKKTDISGKDGGLGMLKSLVSSGWGLIMVLAAAGFILSVMFCGIWLTISPKAGGEVKRHFITKSLIFIGVCGGTFFLSLFMTIAKSLF